MKSNKIIVLTGGHAGSTAYSLIEELKESKNYSFQIYWFGSKYAIEGQSFPTKEFVSLPQLGVKFIHVITGRVQRRFTVWTVPSLFKIPLGIIHSLYLLLKINPCLIVSFGGFSAFPVVVVGWLLQIPIIIHEQTIVVGRANRFTAIFANKIALARKESNIYFPKEKCVITGNPIPKGVITSEPKRTPGKLPVIFIHGGSSGAKIINNNFLEILPRLLKYYRVIHQTGVYQENEFKLFRDKLAQNLKDRYQVFGIIETSQWSRYFTQADILISRSGANIVSEIMIRKIPAILIPIPFTYLDEQTKNAEYAKEFGIAKIIKQENLTPERLWSEIQDTFKNWQTIVGRVKNKPSPDVGAAVKLVGLIEEMLNDK